MINKAKLIQKFLISSKNKFLIITNNDLHLNESPNLNQKDIYNIIGFDCSFGFLLIWSCVYLFKNGISKAHQQIPIIGT